MTTKRIFIVGHMGAGKFLFADALAKKLSWKLIDANPSIESYVGRHTHDILGKEGEAAFNRSQADIITLASHQENVVVLLEECVVASEHCRHLLTNEFVVYLKVSLDTQLERMSLGKRTPALPINDLKKFLEKQHEERDVHYENLATLIVESSGHSTSPSHINDVVATDVDKVLKVIKLV